MATMCKTPVPRLPLDSMVTTQNSSRFCPPLAGDSDRSCGTQARPNYLPMDATSERFSLPMPPLPSPMDTINGGIHAQDPDLSTPQSSGFITPRGGISLATLSLRSPQSAQGRSPHGTPYLSPRSPSMMSPIRMVGMRCPCSVKITSSCKRLSGTPATNASSSPRPSSARRVAHSPNKQKPTVVSRALPFTEPTPAAVAAAAVAQDTMQRFQLPQPQGRELSFSDLLDPNVKHRRSILHHGNVMTLPLGVSTPLNARLADPQPNSAHAVVGGGVSSSPGQQHPTGTPPALSPASVLEGQMTPRKRPRKSAAPQRADFGGDSGDLGDSSHDESSGPGAVAMSWE